MVVGNNRNGGTHLLVAQNCLPYILAIGTAGMSTHRMLHIPSCLMTVTTCNHRLHVVPGLAVSTRAVSTALVSQSQVLSCFWVQSPPVMTPHGADSSSFSASNLCPAEDAPAALQQLQPDPRHHPAAPVPASEASGVLGTSFYISPEIANGWPQYDNKVSPLASDPGPNKHNDSRMGGKQLCSWSCSAAHAHCCNLAAV